jgi:monofunctional biosynthetic peptidoglycan transglycosylase
VSCSSLYLLSPDVAWLKTKNPKTTSMINERNEYYKTLRHPPVKIRYWVKYRSLPEQLIRAVRIAEDDSFFQHHGFDLKQLWEAVRGSVSEGKNMRGASTITQQLGKNLFLSESRSLIRKLQEIPIAYKLEKHLSKRRIFEIYINIIEFGNGIYGIEPASRYYFGKHTTDLNLDESIFLAAIIKRPRYWERHRDSGSFIYRQDIILERMAIYGYIK